MPPIQPPLPPKLLIRTILARLLREVGVKRLQRLSSAVRYAHLPTIEFFLEQYREHGRLEQVLTAGWAGMPLLHHCCLGNEGDDPSLNIAVALVNKWGADVWALSTTSATAMPVTALQLAANHHNIALVDFFITECKMPVNMGVNNSGTPLDWACRNACRTGERNAGETVKYLIEELGADPTLRNRRGFTPAELALANEMPKVHAYLKRVECIYETPSAGEDVTVVAVVAETETDCREESCFAHSTCSISSAEAAPLGLLERQNWLVGSEMNKLACLGSLQALRDHLALACDGFWQTRYAKMSLHVAAAVAAARGHSEFVLYLCKKRGVAVNLITYPILHEVGTPLVNAAHEVHEDLALELMALPDKDLLDL